MTKSNRERERKIASVGSSRKSLRAQYVSVRLKRESRYAGPATSGASTLFTKIACRSGFSGMQIVLNADRTISKLMLKVTMRRSMMVTPTMPALLDQPPLHLLETVHPAAFL